MNRLEILNAVDSIVSITGLEPSDLKITSVAALVVNGTVDNCKGFYFIIEKDLVSLLNPFITGRDSLGDLIVHWINDHGVIFSDDQEDVIFESMSDGLMVETTESFVERKIGKVKGTDLDALAEVYVHMLNKIGNKTLTDVDHNILRMLSDNREVGDLVHSKQAKTHETIIVQPKSHSERRNFIPRPAYNPFATKE